MRPENRGGLLLGACLACLVGGSLGRLTTCPADAPEATYRWVNSGTSLYVEGAGSCVTLSDIYNNADDAPLAYVNADGDEVDAPTGIWLMSKNIYMESGTTLLLHSDIDCDELRILSSSTNPIQLRAFGAYVSLLKTKVFSWSNSKAAYDVGASDGTNARSFISVISEMTHPSDTCEGAADDDAGEGRMDIINSEVGYLGYQAAEAYGISYKVRGYCKDESNPEVFDRVNVRGDIRFSDIHHNWFGMYSYGHQDGLWEYNAMHNNGYYGFDPHDDSDNLRIHNNIVYENGGHGIIASKRCNDVSIQNNEVYDNTYHGIMLHRSSDNAIVRNNTVTSSGSACIALFESFGIEVSGNVCESNAEGIRLSMGSSYNKIFDNQVLNTGDRSYWLYLGSDPVIASTATSGRCTDNLFQDNYIENSPYGVYMSESRDNKVVGNIFVDTVENEWEDSDGLLWTENEVHADFDMKMTTTCLDAGTDFDQIEAAGANIKECT